MFIDTALSVGARSTDVSLFLYLKHCPTDGAMGAVLGCAKNRMGDASVVSRTGKMASRQNCGEWAA